MLSTTLSVIPEPTGALETRWEQSNIYQLSFNSPSGVAGIQGDLVVLEPQALGGCATTYLRDLAGPFPISRGVKAVLQSDGVAREYAIAEGKFNELPAGTYDVCYATKTSGGESVSDFRLLSKQIVLSDKAHTSPSMDIDDTIPLGSDIVVRWSTGIGLDALVVTEGTWIGLYPSRACTSYDVNIHKCYLAFKFLPVNTTSGVVRFSQNDYKEGGDFEVRYFEGDTRHGQGVVCRGLREIQETYLQCALEASAVSRSFFVDAEEPVGFGSDMPGLEALFEGGEEGYEPEMAALTNVHFT